VGGGEFRDGVEGLVEGVAGDVFVVDFDAFEEGLVEQAALGCVCLQVGGLDVVGEIEGEVEGLADLVVVEMVSW
jgi:hypothetical protein